MCLETVASKEDLEKWKAKKGKYVKVYKVCNDNCAGYWRGDCELYRFRRGWNKDKNRHVLTSRDASYPPGFHCFETKRDAEEWRYKETDFEDVLITAYVPKKAVVAMGRQDHGKGVIVSTRIYMPKYPEIVAEVPK